jgi:cytochrome c oxidase assembly factor CtaG
MIIELLIAAAALGGGYGWTKSFVRRRLRFVDAVHTRPAPWIAGGVAALVATPVTLLPLITGVTAVALGLGVGLGVRSAQKDRLLPPGD